jgi:hypothetical protein
MDGPTTLLRSPKGSGACVLLAFLYFVFGLVLRFVKGTALAVPKNIQETGFSP